MADEVAIDELTKATSEIAIDNSAAVLELQVWLARIGRPREYTTATAPLRLGYGFPVDVAHEAFIRSDEAADMIKAHFAGAGCKSVNITVKGRMVYIAVWNIYPDHICANPFDWSRLSSSEKAKPASDSD